jgi:hypothetical protein
LITEGADVLDALVAGMTIVAIQALKHIRNERRATRRSTARWRRDAGPKTRRPRIPTIISRCRRA